MMTANGPKTLYKLTKEWDPDSATWIEPWRTDGGDFDSKPVATYDRDTVNVWEDFDVTTSIKDIVEDEETNYGFLLKFDKKTPTNGIFYHSSNSEETKLRPKMTITYVYEDTEAPTASITSPDNTAVWGTGTTQRIRWKADDNHIIAHNSLYFSSDNGATWTLIDSLSGNRRHYSWKVPDAISSTCRIKVNVYDADANMTTDESDNFTIEQGTGIENIPNAANKLLRITKSNNRYRIFVPFSGSSISVSDVKGRLLYSSGIAYKIGWVNVPVVLPAGIHILRVESANQKIVRKF